ncbi:hypothetical protein GUITHDRAFT_161273 [Guillardia theta CCMP2712]|uniref:PH domain-containing protein n=1 Tax=Guillardia theta (strain CCMP2712) TaxID=905079 RepID=L1JXB4_GUITC|nr:hypothetical protein GUITHDRAFT_161273 [Guillardia theta CCMP2712]EKX52738.1 hypothetical protein GUITHDRAFT_161273 [Guillardia theta CCMP2712]|eukprot:XP_005839718.1 hypothetical protein GUITHDRAFT_161273 [Guillardia theta CCMP2712]
MSKTNGSKDDFNDMDDNEPAQRAMQKGPKKFFKLTFIIYGDRDEVEPILGIASGLKKAGHDVLFISHHSYKGLVEQWGLRFGPGNPYNPQQQYATEYSSMIMAGQSGDLMLSKMIHLNNNFKLIEEATLTCIKRMTDIILCNSLATVVGLAVARRLKLPFMGVFTTPETPTEAWPYMPHGGGKGTFGWSNLMTYSVALRAQWMALRKTVCEWHQKRVGVQRIDDGWRNLAFLHHQDFPVMHGFSPKILGKPADWGRWIHPVGFWVPPVLPGWTPSDDLSRFLAAGPPPVLISFGSMTCADEEGLAAIGLEAARLAGIRVILVSEWPGFTANPRKVPRLHQKKRICGVVTGTANGEGAPVELPSNVLIVDRSVPIQYLLSQCTLVAHSGCTLWTGASLKAGVPCVPCPFVAEQRFWSVHLQELGVASSSLPVEKLSGDALASAITAALANGELSQRAKEVQKMLNSDNGVHQAVDLISRFMQRPWDRTAMQILPRREGDLEMQEGKVFKTWTRYKFVLKDHCLEYHRYLPTGLHDPQVMATFLIPDAEIVEHSDASGQQQFCIEIKDSKGKRMALLAATNAREQDSWIQALKDVSASWETGANVGGGWSTNISSKLRDADFDDTGALISKATKALSLEDTNRKNSRPVK